MNPRFFLFIIMLVNAATLHATPLVKGNTNMLIVEGLAEYGDRLEIVPTDSCDAFEIRAWIRDWERDNTFYPGELVDLSFSVGNIPVSQVGQVISVSEIFDEHFDIVYLSLGLWSWLAQDILEENKMEYLNVAFEENSLGLESNGWPIGDLPDHIGLMQDDCKVRQYGEII
ncbi:MAG: hypothetical protein VW124_17445 [Paracoccaceae bacterium]